MSMISTSQLISSRPYRDRTEKFSKHPRILPYYATIVTSQIK